MKRLSFLLIALALLSGSAFAFNLITDVEQQTQWTLGENAAAGTAIDVLHGGIYGSEFAGIASYRMLSIWYGGIDLPQADNTLKLTDAMKIGFNLNYFLTGFVNRPPEFLQRLVIGPAIAYPLFITPRHPTYTIDFNYLFGSLKTAPMPPPATLVAPSVAPTSRLNLFFEPTAG